MKKNNIITIIVKSDKIINISLDDNSNFETKLLLTIKLIEENKLIKNN